MPVYNIPSYKYQNLIERLTALSNKAVKLGLGKIEFETIGKHFETFKDESYHDVTLQMFEVSIEGQSPIIEEWQFVGKIEPTPNGNVVKAFEELPEKYRNVDMTCDHCHTNRYRKEVYILRHNETNEYKQVGSTCLKDFTGANDILAIANHYEEINILYNELSNEEDYDLEKMSKGETWIKLESFIAYTIEEIHKNGFSSRSKAVIGCATADLVLNTMFPLYGAKRPELQPESTKQAKIIIKWAREELANKERKTDYEHNMALICSEDYIKWSWSGYAASLVPLYNKENSKTNTEHNNEYVGTIKKRETYKLFCEKVIPIHKEYTYYNQPSVTYLHKFRDEQNHLLVWFTSSYELDTGVWYTGKCTVKDHSEYNGEKQTVLTRCKLEEID